MNYTTCHTDLLTKSVSKSPYITKKSRKMMGTAVVKVKTALKKNLHLTNFFILTNETWSVTHSLYTYSCC